MTQSTPSVPCTSWNNDFCAAASSVVRRAWRRWSRHEAAWQVARAATDTTAERRARTHLDAVTRRLAAIPARSFDDVAPKTMIAAWLRCWGDDGDLLPGLEAAIAAETMALQPPIPLD